MSNRRIKVLEEFEWGNLTFGEDRLVRVTMQAEEEIKERHPEKVQVIDISTKEILWPDQPKQAKKTIKKPKTKK